ncbi:MAG: molecular chaperone Tir [Chryseobacterium sp.]|nr:MAG: molecular chaperone Tir [Chryseobacterium sp.]
MTPTCYICFDGDKDMHHYRLMTAWNSNPKFNFNFHNAHDLSQARDSSSEETIKRSLRYRLRSSDILIVLVGESTKNLYKFVRWEIEVAIELGLPIICINLNGSRYHDDDRCPAILRNRSSIHVSYNPAIINYAIANWPRIHLNHSEPRRFNHSVYSNLGL